MMNHFRLSHVDKKVKYIPLFILMTISVSWAEPTLHSGIIDRPPFGSSETYTGIYVDMTDAVAQKSGVTIEKEFYPTPRMPIAMQSGEVDFAIFLAQPSHAEDITCAAVLYEDDFEILFLSGVKITKYEDLYQLENIGVPNGISLPEKIASDMMLKKKTKLIKNYHMGFSMLKYNRIQGILGTHVAFRYENNISPILDNQNIRRFPIAKSKVCFNVSTHSSHRELIDKKILPVINDLIKSGEINAILNRFLMKPPLPVQEHKQLHDE